MYIFEAKDKTGRVIHLTKERYLHILHEHPELSPYLYELESALKYPTKIISGGHDNKIAYYYKYCKDKKNSRKLSFTPS